jgi:hypothetical protein
MDTGKSWRKPSGATRAWFLERISKGALRGIGRDFTRWRKSLSFEGTYQCPCLATFVSLKKYLGNSRATLILDILFSRAYIYTKCE